MAQWRYVVREETAGVGEQRGWLRWFGGDGGVVCEVDEGATGG